MNSPSPAPDPVAAPPCAFPPNDEQWFREELHPHDAAVRGYLKHRFPAVDPDDVMQDSYIKILRAKAAGKIRSTRSFFYTVVSNTALSLLRRKKSYTETPLSETPYLRVLDDGPNAAEAAETQQRFEIMKKAIEELPPRCREIMRLAVLRGRNNAEIAQELGLAENTVRVQLTIGVKKCMDYVRHNGGRE